MSIEPDVVRVCNERRVSRSGSVSKFRVTLNDRVVDTLVILSVRITVVETVVKVVVFRSRLMVLVLSNDTIKNMSGDILGFVFTISSENFS